MRIMRVVWLVIVIVFMVMLGIAKGNMVSCGMSNGHLVTSANGGTECAH